jgi:GGDEF domain-containing protein
LREREWYEAQLKRENASLAEQTRTDALTGLPHRRSLDASLERAITFAAPLFARVPRRPCSALNIVAAIV